MKKLLVLLILLPALLLCACESDDSGSSRRNRDEDGQEQVQTETETDQAVYKMGWAVDTGSCIYYWQYVPGEYDDGALLGSFSSQKPANLVRRDADGSETMLFEGNGGEFAVTSQRIYYQDADFIRSIALDGSDGQELTAGQLVAADETGSWLVIELDGVYHGYNTQKDEFCALFADCSFEAFHEGVVYYSTRTEYGDAGYEDAQKGQVTLRAINVDGTGDRLMVTTEADLYNSYSGYSPAAIQQIRFSEDAVYFSYGSIAGSGAFFQGGKIMRVAFDGSDAQVVAGADELVDANFGVKEDGSVSTTDDQYFVYYEGHLNYFVVNDGLYWMDPVTGMAKLLIGAEQLQEQVSSETFYVAGCEANDGSAIIMVNYCDFDPEQAVGWRDYAVRVKTVVFQLDRGSMELTELYSF